MAARSTLSIQIMVTKYTFLGEVVDFRSEGKKMYKRSLEHSVLTESKEAMKSTSIGLKYLKCQFEETPTSQT